MKATLSTAAAVLTLGLWLGGLSCRGERRCVDIDVVESGVPSSQVPFCSGMEVEFLYEGLDADPRQTISIGFYIVKDGKQVANVIVKEDSNNELKEVIFNFRTDKWGKARVNKSEGPFNVGILRRVRLEYSEGLYEVAVWDKDRQRIKTWSSRGDPTTGQGNLTIFARISDNKKYSSVVYWPQTCPPAPPSASHCQASVAVTPTLLQICVLIALAVTSLILLALVFWQLREQRKESSGSKERRQRGAL